MSCHCGCGNELNNVRNKIAELEKDGKSAELAALYAGAAVLQFESGGELNDIVAEFNKAEVILIDLLAENEDVEIRRALGNVYLQRAVAYNDYDDYEAALESYGDAVKTLKPLDDAGDGEAKYDIAGIKLNRGTIKHEIGGFEEAKTDFDEAFTAFRAVEKISELDTRYFMAKVSVAQGHLFRDMVEPIDKVVDAYNRAMRLFVELIEGGDLTLERELANALIGRCNAYYEEYKEGEFESEEKHSAKIEDVLLDIRRAIGILQRIVDEGDESDSAKADLFYPVSTEGSILFDLERFEEAKSVYDGIIKNFSEFAEEEDPVLLNHYASAHESRGACFMHLDDQKSALGDFDESIKLAGKIQSPSFDLEDDERFLFLPSLATYYANRANCYAALGQLDKAREDGNYGLELVKSLKENIGEEADIFIEIFEQMLEQWK
ncbi:MAG: hypothetical protein FWE67_04200 [Planctomycetaceae bacterium]|nr:hypothetical protein [Planctomycetaceae bacterium]